MPTADGLPPSTAVPIIHNIFGLSDQTLGEVKLWLEQQGLIVPLSQVAGFQRLLPKFASVVPEAHTTSSVFADPSVSGGAGPQLLGLPAGVYLVAFGGSGGGTIASNVAAHMGVSVNGSTPSDNDACEFFNDGHVSGSRMILVDLSNSSSNSLKCVYRSSDGTDRCDVRYRWLVAFQSS